MPFGEMKMKGEDELHVGDLKHSHDKSLLLSHTTFTQSSCHGFLSESIWHPGMFPLNTVLFDWIKEAG